MIAIYQTNIAFDPFLPIVAFWINKVKSGGDWDYKVKDGFAPYYKEFCTCYDGQIKHITSEYFGNFNYGFTGRLLFPLTVLYAGSYAVAGFNAKDIDDWPAITDGYNHGSSELIL